MPIGVLSLPVAFAVCAKVRIKMRITHKWRPKYALKGCEKSKMEN